MLYYGFVNQHLLLWINKSPENDLFRFRINERLPMRNSHTLNVPLMQSKIKIQHHLPWPSSLDALFKRIRICGTL